MHSEAMIEFEDALGGGRWEAHWVLDETLFISELSRNHGNVTR